MTGAAQMRRVMAHAAESLEQNILTSGGQRSSVYVAAAYAKGVLDLLGTYLIDAEPEPSPLDGMTLHLIDAEGTAWQGSDVAGWSCDEESEAAPLTRHAIVAEHGSPLREAWVR